MSDDRGLRLTRLTRQQRQILQALASTGILGGSEAEVAEHILKQKLWEEYIAGHIRIGGSDDDEAARNCPHCGSPKCHAVPATMGTPEHWQCEDCDRTF